MTRGPLTILAVALAAACGTPMATANFRGVHNPVLLGPRERLGDAKAPPAASAKVRDFSVEAFEAFTQTSSYAPGGSSTTLSASTAARLPAAALRATGGDPALDIRITDLNPKSKGNIAGYRVAVEIEADVVRPGGKP
ncbi:MAG TPA: hypothetical protein VH880_06005 [Anaeromyxobacteraceae bacterium]|jgi:hypothetical protein